MRAKRLGGNAREKSGVDVVSADVRQGAKNWLFWERPLYKHLQQIGCRTFWHLVVDEATQTPTNPNPNPYPNPYHLVDPSG